MKVVFVIQELTEGAFIGDDGLGGMEYVRKLDEAFRFKNLNIALLQGFLMVSFVCLD